MGGRAIERKDRIDALGGVLLGCGGVVVLGAFRHYRSAEFLGLDQLRANGIPEHAALNTSGWNARVRHPLYFGTLLALVGGLLVSCMLEHCVFVGISIAYLYVGATLEERKLVKAFGDEYRAYQREVPMLIPRLSM